MDHLSLYEIRQIKSWLFKHRSADDNQRRKEELSNQGSS